MAGIGTPTLGSSGSISSVTISSIAAGDNNIGNVDIVTVPNDPFGLNADAASATGSISAKLRFIASTGIPITGTVTVDGSGVTQPVSGTVTANLSATDNQVLDDIAASLSVLDDWDDANYANVNMNVAGTDVAAGAGTISAQTIRVTIATDDEVNNSLATIDANTSVLAQWDNTASDGASVSGDVAHDGADAGEPVKIGGVAVSGSASPTSVAASDRTRWIFNQHGIPYTMAGHPNLITREYDFGTTAQTDTNLAAAAVAADERVYVTRLEATCDNANTVNVSVRAGFGAANVPSASSSGVSGMINSHPGLAPGSGIVSGTGSGIIAVGGAGEEPRLTSSAATGGNLHVIISYYLIDETP